MRFRQNINHGSKDLKKAFNFLDFKSPKKGANTAKNTIKCQALYLQDKRNATIIIGRKKGLNK